VCIAVRPLHGSGITLRCRSFAVESCDSDVRSGKPDVRLRKPGVRLRKPDVRSREPDVRSRKPDVRSRNCNVGSRKSDVGSRHLNVGSRGLRRRIAQLQRRVAKLRRRVARLQRQVVRLQRRVAPVQRCVSQLQTDTCATSKTHRGTPRRVVAESTRRQKRHVSERVCYRSDMLHIQLREAREAMNLSQAELARVSGVPRDVLRKIENGGNFTRDTLLRIVAQLPDLRQLSLGAVTIHTGTSDTKAVRAAVEESVAASRRALALLDAAQSTASEPAAGATRFEGGGVTPELEARLRRLESSIPAAPRPGRSRRRES